MENTINLQYSALLAREIGPGSNRDGCRCPHHQECYTVYAAAQPPSRPPVDAIMCPGSLSILSASSFLRLPGRLRFRLTEVRDIREIGKFLRVRPCSMRQDVSRNTAFLGAQRF